MRLMVLNSLALLASLALPCPSRAAVLNRIPAITAPVLRGVLTSPILPLSGAPVLTALNPGFLTGAPSRARADAGQPVLAPLPAPALVSFTAAPSPPRIDVPVQAARPDAAGHAIGHMTIVEGSKAAGGTQTDFLVDYDDPDLRDRIVRPARELGRQGLDFWETVRRAQRLVNTALPINGYTDEAYQSHNRAVYDRPFVSLGGYVRLGRGVCRENALLTVIALREAGIAARFAYFDTVSPQGTSDGDHAVALVEYDGTTFVVDSFRPFGRYYNGHRLEDMLRPPADRLYTRASPLAAGNDKTPEGWGFAANPFPKVRSVPLFSDSGSAGRSGVLAGLKDLEKSVRDDPARTAAALGRTFDKKPAPGSP